MSLRLGIETEREQASATRPKVLAIVSQAGSHFGEAERIENACERTRIKRQVPCIL